ncbi:P-loop containing nucleoside triphosphate hydrolase protein [Chaetomium fimeti]|uniref:P-loop containing nucleoside triphosphate hydrolase protein n=1 Tax=Chaetomium fimeti TaxID=1854472 RepID=A0AAE0HJW4_9PEZI|nr:P-loop containing nucleoside triphosphate hydrolase protein [Chaetomium fimeti]
MAVGTSKRNGGQPKVKAQTPSKALPVTLLSGFLGSGKTTLLQHILKTEHGLRIAVVVNDIGAINVDASLIKQTHRLTRTEEKVIALQNGCICCTLRGDLLEELLRLAELEQFDYIIIESSGISEPEQVAETFDKRLAEQMSAVAGGPEGLDEDMVKVLKRLKAAGGLEKFARLDTTVTVIDAFTIYNDFETDDMLSSRREDVQPEDERTVSDLMVDQIEFADVIVLNKMEMVDTKMRARIRDLLSKLNHRAKILETSYGKIEVREIINTGIFSLERAQTGYGWLQDLHAMTLRQVRGCVAVNGKKVITPKPETEEYNIRNFVYTRTRPFHPRRLFKLLHDKFIMQLEVPDDDDDDDDEDDDSDSAMDSDASSSSSDSPSDTDMADDDDDPLDMPPNATILRNKRASPIFSRLFRSKGEFLLATRPHRAGEWSQAGAMITLAGGRPWFCTLPAEQYMTGDAEVDRLVRFDMENGGEWGDRRQELVFIGEGLDVRGLEAVLDGCLLTDEEFGAWEGVMRDGGLDDGKRVEKMQELFDDGFPDWVEDGELEDGDGHDGHDHGSHAHHHRH